MGELNVPKVFVATWRLLRTVEAAIKRRANVTVTNNQSGHHGDEGAGSPRKTNGDKNWG